MKLTPEHIAAALRGMSANWRTSILGVLLLAQVALSVAGYRLPPEASEIVTSVILGVALLATRDWNVSSEASGAKDKDIHRGDAESAEQGSGSSVKASIPVLGTLNSETGAIARN